MSKSLVLTDKLTIVKPGRENKWIKVETVGKMDPFYKIQDK